MASQISELQAESISVQGRTTGRFKRMAGSIWKYKMLYALSLPGIAYFILFKYIPMLSSVIAFQNYNIFSGIAGSKWVGLEHFRLMFDYPKFLDILQNTLLINLYDLVLGFPAPLVLALLLNELRKVVYKRVVQTIIYMPHFLSWIIVGGITIAILSPSSGFVNRVIEWFGGQPVYFMGDEKYTRSIIILTGMFRDTGWGTIIYLAALAGVNPNLYEAAEIDGANRWKQTLLITIPSILPTITILLLLRIGNFLDFGFERVYVFLNSMNASTGDIFDTYIYEAGLLQMQYSYSTAVGLFKSVVGFLLLTTANSVSRKTSGESLY